MRVVDRPPCFSPKTPLIHFQMKTHKNKKIFMLKNNLIYKLLILIVYIFILNIILTVYIKVKSYAYMYMQDIVGLVYLLYKYMMGILNFKQGSLTLCLSSEKLQNVKYFKVDKLILIFSSTKHANPRVIYRTLKYKYL